MTSLKGFPSFAVLPFAFAATSGSSVKVVRIEASTMSGGCGCRGDGADVAGRNRVGGTKSFGVEWAVRSENRRHGAAGEACAAASGGGDGGRWTGMAGLRMGLVSAGLGRGATPRG